MPVARLETIRRQLDPGLREAVTLASRGEIGQAIALLEQQGRIREIVDPNERHAAIAREYLGAHEAGEKVLVVSPANDERRQLNAANSRSPQGTRARRLRRARTDRARKPRADPPSAQTSAELRSRRCAPIPARKCATGHRPRELCPHRSNRSGAEPNRGAAMKEERLSATIPRDCPGSRSSIRSAACLAAGDRIQFRAPDRALGVANGEFATIIAIDDRKSTAAHRQRARDQRGNRSSEAHRLRLRLDLSFKPGRHG